MNNRTPVRRVNTVSELTRNIIASLPKEVVEDIYPDAVGDTFIRKTAAIEKGTFIETEPGMFKESASETDYGKIWFEKEYTNPQTGNSEKWLVSYVDDDENIIRSVSNEATDGMKKAASLKKKAIEWNSGNGPNTPAQDQTEYKKFIAAPEANHVSSVDELREVFKDEEDLFSKLDTTNVDALYQVMSSKLGPSFKAAGYVEDWNEAAEDWDDIGIHASKIDNDDVYVIAHFNGPNDVDWAFADNTNVDDPGEEFGNISHNEKTAAGDNTINLLRSKLASAVNLAQPTSMQSNSEYDSVGDMSDFIKQYPGNTNLIYSSAEPRMSTISAINSGTYDELLTQNQTQWTNVVEAAPSPMMWAGDIDDDKANAAGVRYKQNLRKENTDDSIVDELMGTDEPIIDEGTVKSKIEAFLDHPWQEDTEIQLTTMLNEYRSNLEELGNEAIQYVDYIKGFVNANKDAIYGNQMIGDKFISDLQDIVGEEVLASLKTEAGDMKDMPIAPGIKSKNVTVDETGAGGTAKVTIEFTDADQGYKFYQELGGTAPAPAAPVAPAAGAEGGGATDDQMVAELEGLQGQAPAQQPATNMQGGQPQVASSLKKEAGSYDDFMMGHMEEIKQALTYLDNMRKVAQTFDEEIDGAIVDAAGAPYDKYVIDSIGRWMFNNTTEMREIMDVAMRNQTTNGTEPVMVLNAIADVYEALLKAHPEMERDTYSSLITEAMDEPYELPNEEDVYSALKKKGSLWNAFLDKFATDRHLDRSSLNDCYDMESLCGEVGPSDGLTSDDVVSAASEFVKTDFDGEEGEEADEDEDLYFELIDSEFSKKDNVNKVSSLNKAAAFLSVDHFDPSNLSITDDFDAQSDYSLEVSAPFVFGDWNDEGAHVVYSGNSVEEIYTQIIKDEYFNDSDWGFSENNLQYLTGVAGDGVKYADNIDAVAAILKNVCTGSYVDMDSSSAYFLINIKDSQIISGPDDNGIVFETSLNTNPDEVKFKAGNKVKVNPEGWIGKVQQVKRDVALVFFPDTEENEEMNLSDLVAISDEEYNNFVSNIDTTSALSKRSYG